jgi:hypothetical protein
VTGGIAAAALAVALHAFAVGIALSVGSTAPTSGDASFALVLLSALYEVLAALASYGSAVTWWALCARGRSSIGKDQQSEPEEQWCGALACSCAHHRGGLS